MAAALLLASVGASALDVVAQPGAEGYRPGYWFPLHLLFVTDKEPFRGEVVLRLERAQVHRVPLDMPSFTKREAWVGVMPFDPSVRVEIEAGDVRQTLDLALAAEPLSVHAPSDAAAELWEGVQPGLRRPWGLTQGKGTASGSPSICPAFVRALEPARIGPQRRRSFLISLGGIALLLVVTLVATRGRGRKASAFSWALACAAGSCAALWLPAERPAVSAVAFVGQVDEAAWQAQGFGCASRGTDGDVVLSLPGVPRPLFEGLVEAREASWGCVWRDGRVELVFPARKAGEGCWFAWQTETKVHGGVIRGADGTMSNETSLELAPALICGQPGVLVEESLPREQRFAGAKGNLPAPLSTGILDAVEPDWRHETFFLGGTPAPPPSMEGCDLVQGKAFLWVPMPN